MTARVGPARDRTAPDRAPARSVGVHAARNLLLAVIGLLALVTASAVGYAAKGPQPPADDGPDAGFASDMQNHHAQAVEMAFLIRDRTSDPTIRTIAYDIITSQQQQIGQMYGWLRLWGLPQTSSRPPMAWMNDGSNQGGMGMPDAGDETRAALSTARRMPGMATDAQLRSLRDATGREAEVLFLRLMIAHHRGGVAMASTARRLAESPEVRSLAGAIAAAQRAEITQMRQLLRDRGVASP